MKRTKFKIKSKIFLLDATTISLCLNLFDWAKYKTKKDAAKMHTLLDYNEHLPAYANITDSKTADNRGAYDVPLLKGIVIVADRFYNDFSLLNVWGNSGVYFVVRYKNNIKFKTLKKLELPENRHQHVLKDEIIELIGNKTKDKPTRKLHRVALWDDKNQQTIEVITNQMSWTANTITELYKARWEVEIFFRDIKQQLHIKSFISTSQNAVMIQIWTALKTQAKHS